MSGIRLWRCSRCCDKDAVVAVDRTRLFCGDCFYAQTVERIMAAAFAPAPSLETPAPVKASAPRRQATAAVVDRELVHRHEADAEAASGKRGPDRHDTSPPSIGAPFNRNRPGRRRSVTGSPRSPHCVIAL